MNSRLRQYAAITLCALSVTVASPNVSAEGVITLQRIDTVPGTGKYAFSGKTVTVHYTGWIYDQFAPQQRGEKFDSSIGGPPLVFQVGTRKVIRGWEQGIVGMKVGGKRTLIIPSELAYGATGNNNIPPDANLLFEIELLNVE